MNKTDASNYYILFSLSTSFPIPIDISSNFSFIHTVSNISLSPYIFNFMYTRVFMSTLLELTKNAKSSLYKSTKVHQYEQWWFFLGLLFIACMRQQKSTLITINNHEWIWPYLQLVDGRNTLISSLTVIFFLHVGHLAWALIAALMQALQKIWPHLVDISSTKGPIHIGQLKTGSFGGSGGKFSPCKRNNQVR